MKRITTIIALFALFCTFSTGAYAGPDGDDIKKAKTEAEAKAALVAYSCPCAMTVDSRAT